MGNESQQCSVVYLSETCLFINPPTTGDLSSCAMCWSKQLSHKMQSFSPSVMKDKVNTDSVNIGSQHAGCKLASPVMGHLQVSS